MNKFQRIIWSINGVLILLVFLFIGAVALKEFFTSFRYNPPELIVGEELKRAKEKGLILQGLEYPNLIAVYKSPWWILPVEVKTFENPREFHSMEKESLSFGSKAFNMLDYSNTVNIIFLNSDLEPVHTLLDRKAFIKSFHYPALSDNKYSLDYEITGDTIANHLTYLISYQDSNNDGALDTNDLSDLYISDLDGKDLRQVTKEVDVIHHRFLDPDHILIRYIKRTKEEAEHKREYFARYTISENKLEDLNTLHTSLYKLEKMLF